MKKIFFFLALLSTIAASAQNNIPVVFLPENLTLHFISPEPISYVDISSKQLVGDLPLKNVLRIKLRDSARFDFAVVTITGEKFIAQYRLLPGGINAPTEINIVPADTKPLDIAGVGLSQNQLKALSLNLITKNPDKRVERVKAFGVTGQLNHLYTLGDYIFLDISYKNRTLLRYDIDDFRFKIDDKKVTKASNIQSVELKPEFTLLQVPSFERHYRNIFVFRKMTFPGNKIFHIDLSEKQYSGRIITLGISYSDMLNADILPN